VRGEVYTLEDWVDQFGGTNAGDLEDVRTVVDRANELVRRETLKRIRRG
jgi:hypothetical protein